MSDGPVPWWDDAVLARDRWSSVVEPTLERILRARNRDRLPHALLLVGPSHLGRELAAVEIAVLLVCAGADQPWSQSNCADRLRIGHHPDVEAVLPSGAKKIIKIERVREVIDAAPGRPFEGLRRIWIFDGVEAESFPKASANAFLKMLEEPPAHAMFILLAANPMAVLPTIRSRCQQLSLPGPIALAEEVFGGLPLPELASLQLSAEAVEDVVSEIRKSLTAGLDGEVKELLQLSYLLPPESRPFSIAAAVAAEMACEEGAEDVAEDLVRLAAELLSAERRTRALNMNSRAQIASCLVKWQLERGR